MAHLVDIFFGVLVFGAMVWIFRAQIEKKKLSYEIISITRLLKVETTIREKVQVIYEGREVQNVHLLTLKFINNGNQAISSSDYEHSIDITLNDKAVIMTHEIIDEKPTKLKIRLKLRGKNTILLSRALLNRKDSFSVKVLISDFDGHIEVGGRIKGVKHISERKEPSHFPIIMLTAISTIVPLILIIVLIANNFDVFVFNTLAFNTSTISGMTMNLIWKLLVFIYLLMGAAMLIVMVTFRKFIKMRHQGYRTG